MDNDLIQTSRYLKIIIKALKKNDENIIYSNLTIISASAFIQKFIEKYCIYLFKQKKKEIIKDFSQAF